MYHPFTSRIHICFLSIVLLSVWAVSVFYMTVETHSYTFKYFSYWGFSVCGTYLAFISVATLFNLPRLLLFISLFLQPLAQGTCILIVIIISIIVRHTPDLVERILSDRPLTSELFSAVRDGDWLIHGFTVISILFICSVGFFNTYVSRCMYAFTSTHNNFVNFLLAIWWIFTPFFLIGVYTLCGNWAPEQYGTNLPALLSFSEVFIFSLVVQIPSYVACTIQSMPDDMKFTNTFSEKTTKKHKKTKTKTKTKIENNEFIIEHF